MSYKLEKVFSDTGSELSTGALNTTLGQGVQSCYDGRFMWVTAANGIGIYEFWGASSDDEPTVDEVDDLTWQRYTEQGPQRKLKLVTFINITSGQVKRSTRYLNLSLVPGWTGGAGSTTVSGTAVTLTQSRSDLLVCTEVSTNTYSTALSPYFICKWYDKMYVSSGANFTKIFVFDIASQRLVDVIGLGFDQDGSTALTANSNLIAENGYLWFVNTFFNDITAQRMYRVRCSDKAITSSAINIRPASTRTWLASGFNGYVYATNFNGVSIAKFDTTTGAQADRIRVNGLPTRIFSDQNRRIFVGSFAGMLSLVDWDDDGVHNDYSYGDGTLFGFASDTTDSTKVWFTDGTLLARYDLNNKEQLETGPSIDSVEQWVPVAPGGTATLQRNPVDDAVSIPGLEQDTDYTVAGATITFSSDVSTLGANEALASFDSPAQDWIIKESGIASPDWIEVVPGKSYTTGTGAIRTQRPYVFVIDNSTVRLFALDNYLIRDNYFEVNGSSAVVGGSLMHFGETNE